MPGKFKRSGKITISSKNLSSAIYLVIVESPSKCMKIEGFLGSLYACIASMGHIRSLKSLKDVNAKKGFTPEFSYIENKKPHIEKMQEIIANFHRDNIFIATDDDREGEAIAWHLCETFQLDISTTKRIKFHEITERAVQNAIKSPGHVDIQLVNSALARQVLDITVGHKLSPLLWRRIYNSKESPLSVGRCQTTALRLVYDNHLLERGDGEVKYRLKGMFTEYNIQFALNHTFDTCDALTDYMKKHTDFTHTMEKSKPKTKIVKPPLPFNTSALIQKACDTLKMNPHRVMTICQELYQQGHITYMRTESRKYSKEYVETCRKFITDKFDKNAAKGSDDIINKNNMLPHEAIRVTNIHVSDIPEKDCRALYKVIWKNSIESCMSDARYAVYTYSISAPDNHKYTYNAELPSCLGWKHITNDPADVPPIMYLDSIIQKGSVIRKHIESDITYSTGSKPHYSESTLVKKLEDMGIGRPSTFSSIVQTIIDRKYVKVTDIPGRSFTYKIYKLVDKLTSTEKNTELGNEKNRIMITTVGILAVTFMHENFTEFFDYDYTRDMEAKLDEIATDPAINWKDICRETYTAIQDKNKDIPPITKVGFPIDDQHVLQFEGFGPVIRKNAENEVSFIKVKPDLEIDIDIAKNKGYKLCDIAYDDNLLGEYNGSPILLKHGQYGKYIECGSKKVSLKTDVEELTTKKVIELLEADKDSSIIRSFTPTLSIRRGKYGPYVFYKTTKMPKPKFLSIKRCPVGYMSCTTSEIISWLEETYKMTIE